MANTTNTTTVFRADITDFKASIQEVNRIMKVATSEFKATSSSMEDWEKDIGGLQAKIKQLDKTLEAQERGLSALEVEYKKVCQEQGENSTAAQNLKVRMNNQIAAINKTKVSLSTYSSKLEDAKGNSEILANTINRQKRELAELNKKYDLVAKASGTESNAAKQLKSQIDSLNSELKENKSALQQVDTEADDLDDTLDDVSDSANDAANNGFSALTVTLGNLATDAIHMAVQGLKDFVGAIKECVDVSATFDQSMSKVESLISSSSQDLSGDMEKLTAIAEEMGEKTKFTAAESADALSYMALAGWDANEMVEGLPSVLNLAVASEMDLASASDIVTDYLTAFGLEAKDSEKFVDQMAYAMANSNTNVEQLGEAYKNVAATAHSMGVSVEDTTASIMTLANSGIKGGEAGTALNSIMTRLATDTSNAATELKALGIDIYDESGKMKDYGEIMKGMTTALSNMTDEEKANISKTIAGKTAYSDLQVLINGLAPAADRATSSFEDYANALANVDGTAQDMANTMSDNLNGDLDKFHSKVEALQKQIGDALEPYLRQFFQFLTNTVLPFVQDKIIPAIQNLLDFLGSNVVPTIQKAFGFITETVIPKLKEIKQYFENAANTIGSIVAPAIEDLKKAFGDLKSSLSPIVERIKPIASTVFSLAKEYIPKLLGAIAKLKIKAMSAIIKGISTAINVVKDALQKASPVVEHIKTSFEHLKEAFKPVVDGIKNLVDGFKEWNDSADATSKKTKVLEVIGTVLQAIFEHIGVVISVIMEQIAAFITLWRKAFEKASPIIDVIKESINNLFEALTPLKEAFEHIMDAVRPLVDKFLEFIGATDEGSAKMEGMEVVSSILAGALEAIGWVISTLIDAITSLIKVITWIIDSVAWLIDGGYKEIIDKTGAFFKKIWDTVVTTLSNLVNNIVEFVKSIPRRLKSAGSEILNGVKNKVTEIWNYIIETLKGLPDQIKTIGKNIITGLWNGIKEKLDWLSNKLNNVGDTVVGGLKDVLGIHSPSKVLRDEVGKYIPMGLAEGIKDAQKYVDNAWGDITDGLNANINVNGKGGVGGNGNVTNNYYNTFNQTNNSPKALSRLDIYRQTRNQLAFAQA